MPKFKVGQRVQMVNSHSPQHTGTITEIETRYIVDEDGGFSYWHDEDNLQTIPAPKLVPTEAKK